MLLRTSRFGVVEIAEDRVITFAKGLLGFPNHTRFCLLEPGDEAVFFWLQSIDDPALAFVVTDPGLFFSDYAVPIKADQMGELGLQNLSDAQVFVIVNKIESNLTGNLQGPLIVNTLARRGEQVVLAEKRWTTRHVLMQVGEPAMARAVSA